MPRRLLLIATMAIAALIGRLWPRPRKSKSLRPPGAQPESAFLQACIRCFRCAEVCPVKAIDFAKTWDLTQLDTPIIEARSRACILCMRCTQVCPTDALAELPFDLVTIQKSVKMGYPNLRRASCLAWNGKGLCRLCHAVCPYPDSAIVLDGPKMRPIFVRDACVGCGLCEEACPEHARAIQIDPLPAA